MKYIKYTIRNTGPLRITDSSTSQQGQMETLTYIPGSSIRGYVIGRFVQDNSLPDYKQALLSDDCRFLNAYSSFGTAEERQLLIPPLKGFYEDKTGDEPKKLVNVVVNSDPPGTHKRSSLGDGVLLYKKDNDDNVITMKTYSLVKGSDLRIRINADRQGSETALFRNDYIAPGHEFTGYIAVQDANLADEIIKRFGDEIKIGNARTSGYGRCKVIDGPSLEDAFPYSRLAVEESQESSCYMALLSNTVMRNELGEYCGLNKEKLGGLMGVKKLEIERCATSLADVRGYNRTWGGHIPSVKMYDKGSVFKLKYEGSADIGKLNALMEEGIGVRRNEGFGQILFIKDYDQIKYRVKGTETLTSSASIQLEKEDEEVLKRIARSYYCKMIEEAMVTRVAAAGSNNNPIQLKGVSKSQLGTLEALASSFRYNPEEGITRIRELFAHSSEKSSKTKRQSEANSLANVSSVFLGDILDTDLEEVLGLDQKWKGDTIMEIPRKELLEEQEENRYKLELISKIIRFDYKED